MDTNHSSFSAYSRGASGGEHQPTSQDTGSMAQSRPMDNFRPAVAFSRQAPEASRHEPASDQVFPCYVRVKVKN